MKHVEKCELVGHAPMHWKWAKKGLKWKADCNEGSRWTTQLMVRSQLSMHLVFLFEHVM